MADITIFEGPDGGGKTTAAKKFAQETQALYYHFSAWRHMERQLSRLYVEAMMPALLGLKNVVLDRSWLSEKPYSFFHGEAPVCVKPYDERVLERLAMRVNTKVVLCLPDFEVCVRNFDKRRGEEMLKRHSQLARVYETYAYMPDLRYIDFNSYRNLPHSLPLLRYDYTKDGSIKQFVYEKFPTTFIQHPIENQNTVGNLSANNIVVTDDVTIMAKNDSINRFHTITFNNLGPEYYITHALHRRALSENALLWTDSAGLEGVLEIRDSMSVPLPKKVFCVDDRLKDVVRGILPTVDIEVLVPDTFKDSRL